MQDLIENAEKQPNITIGVLVAIAVVILSVILKVLFGGKKKVFSYYALLLISEMDSLTHQKRKCFLPLSSGDSQNCNWYRSFDLLGSKDLRTGLNKKIFLRRSFYLMSSKCPVNVQGSTVAETEIKSTTQPSDGQGSSAEEDEGEKDGAAPRRRANRRET